MMPFSMKDPDGRPWPRWVLLILISLALVVCLELLHLPAALLLGPMIAAIALVVSGVPLNLPQPLFILAQGVVGMMIADHLPVDIFHEIAGDWVVFLAGTSSTIITSAFLGWLLAKSGMLPGTTAIWGSSPGAASVMTLMCEDYGADMRLVAFMQYLRVACCALSTTLAAGFLGHAGTALHHTDWWGIHSWPGLAMTTLLTVASPLIGVRLRIPGGALVLPLILGLIVKLTAVIPIVLPQWLLALSYAILGWVSGFGSRQRYCAMPPGCFPIFWGPYLFSS